MKYLRVTPLRKHPVVNFLPEGEKEREKAGFYLGRQEEKKGAKEAKQAKTGSNSLQQATFSSFLLFLPPWTSLRRVPFLLPLHGQKCHSRTHTPHIDVGRHPSGDRDGVPGRREYLQTMYTGRHTGRLYPTQGIQEGYIPTQGDI